MLKKIALILLISLIAGIVYIFTYVPELSSRHGIIQSKLYLGESNQQALVVAFGGGDGGNDWTRNYLKGKRDSLIQKGFALLAIGYFNTEATPKYLDRISLDAIRDTILEIANHPKIDKSNIILIGGSRGGELVLNLASRYDDFNGVVAMSASNVSFPAITWSANTSSWTHNNMEVPYVPAPLKTITPALKGDLYTAHAMMLEDHEAVIKAEIPVEKIKGPILILSGKDDDQWPATKMSNDIIKRLEANSFKYYHSHIVLEGGHIAPLENFSHVYDFLEENYKSE